MASNLVQVNWETRKKVLFSNLNVLRNKEIHTDITLSCGGMNYPAHRLVLSMSSGYFARAFESSKVQPSLVLICGIKTSILEDLLSFIYEGTTTINSGDIPDLLKAGLLLEIPGLMEMGSNYMVTNNFSKHEEHIPEKSVCDVPSPDAKNIDESSYAMECTISSDATKGIRNQSESNFVIADDNEEEQQTNISEEFDELVQLSDENYFHTQHRESEFNKESKLNEEREFNKGSEFNEGTDCNDEENDNMDEPLSNNQSTLLSSELLFSDSTQSEGMNHFEGWENGDCLQTTSKVVKKKRSTKGCKKSHRCHLCQRRFYKMNSLTEHIQSHTTIVAFPCKYCIKSFSDEKLYISHLESHSVPNKEKKSRRRTKPTYESYIADLKSKNKRRKKNEHSTNSTIDDVLKSVSQSFKTLPFNEHSLLPDDRIYDFDADVDIKKVNQEGVANEVKDNQGCSISEEVKIELLKDSLELKQSVASVQTKYCNYCSIEFLDTRGYKKHRTTTCKVLECPFCLSNFQIEEKEIYEEHVETHQGVEKPYLCPQCDFCTDDKRSFEDHVSIHTGEYRHWCTICNYQARKMKEIRIHTLKRHPEVNIDSLPNNQEKLENKTEQDNE